MFDAAIAMLVLVSASPQEAKKSDAPYVEFYDVRDLALPARIRALLPESGPQAAKEPTAAADGVGKADEGVRANVVAWNLLEALFRVVGTRTDPDFSCNAQPSGALIVRTRPEVHARLQAILAALRDPEPEVVTVEMQLFSLDRKQRALLVELENPDAANDPHAAAQIARVSQATIDKLHASGVTTVSAPTVVTYELDPLEVRAGSEVSYLAGYDMVAIEGIGTIADPVVKTLFEGVKVEGRVVAAPGFEWKETPFALRLEVESSVLKRPIETVKSDAGEIQLPETRHATIATTVAGTVGGTFLVGGVPTPSFDPKEQELRLYLLVTVGAPTSPSSAHARSAGGK